MEEAIGSNGKSEGATTYLARHSRRSPRPRFTTTEKSRIRAMLARDLSHGDIAQAVRDAGRPWFTAKQVSAFKAAHGKRLRRPAARVEQATAVPETGATVTISVGAADPVTFRTGKKTIKAVLELLVGV